MIAPVVETHEGTRVVRDDLFPGGTKARFLPALFAAADEVVYASPAEGGAQTALAHVAAALGKRATIFVARRAERHPRTREAARLGARIEEVSPGYLGVVQSWARGYAARTGALLAPFGMDMPGAVAAIAEAASATGEEPEEVWCAAGSGVLMRALAAAWPRARRVAVQIGRALKPADVAGAEIVVHPLPFGRPCKAAAPFPADPHYDAKAWELCRARRGPGRVLFWNVAGPARP
ncbi:pyridoxal-phosphate dependent enzyme [Elioraea sp.]|uniref:pyridoxal-phosphate dependent enzyme n=1 Tax=Elioraea sp. TaxID=2185103 RepID=UPI003F723FB2